jgi:hypothetical protein
MMKTTALESVAASTSHNHMGLHCLLQDYLDLFRYLWNVLKMYVHRRYR